MKINRCIGLRKFLEKLNVRIIVATPRMDSAEAARPTLAILLNCSSERIIMNTVFHMSQNSMAC